MWNKPKVNQLIKIFFIEEFWCKSKKKNSEYRAFRKERHELITGVHQILFHTWITVYKKVGIQWTNLYPKIQNNEI